MRIEIANIELLAKDTEYDWAIPRGCQWFTLHVRDGTAIRIATEPKKVAESNAPYYTLTANGSLTERSLEIDVSEGLLLYFACGSDAKVVEVIMGIYEEVPIGPEVS